MTGFCVTCELPTGWPYERARFITGECGACYCDARSVDAEPSGVSEGRGPLSRSASTSSGPRPNTNGDTK